MRLSLGAQHELSVGLPAGFYAQSSVHGGSGLFRMGRAGGIGIDLKKLLMSQPDCGEQALEIAEALTRSGAVDLIVIDSVAALVPKAEIEGDMGDSHMGLQARLMSQALRKLTAIANKSTKAPVRRKKAPKASPTAHALVELVPAATSVARPGRYARRLHKISLIPGAPQSEIRRPSARTFPIRRPVLPPRVWPPQGRRRCSNRIGRGGSS